MFLRSLIWWLKQRVCTHIIALCYVVLCLWNAFCYWVRGSVLYFHLVGLGLGSHSYCIVNRELIESWPIRDTLVRCCRAASWYLKTSHNVVINHDGSLLDAVGVNVRPYKMVVQGKEVLDPPRTGNENAYSLIGYITRRLPGWLFSIVNCIGCQAISCDQNLLLPYATRTVKLFHCWEAMTISGNLSLAVQQTSQLNSYCFFAI